MELFASACVLSRWDDELQTGSAGDGSEGASGGAAELFLRGSFRRARRSLAEMHENDDAAVTATADWVRRVVGSYDERMGRIGAQRLRCRNATTFRKRQVSIGAARSFSRSAA